MASPSKEFIETFISDERSPVNDSPIPGLGRIVDDSDSFPSQDEDSSSADKVDYDEGEGVLYEYHVEESSELMNIEISLDEIDVEESSANEGDDTSKRRDRYDLHASSEKKDQDGESSSVVTSSEILQDLESLGTRRMPGSEPNFAGRQHRSSDSTIKEPCSDSQLQDDVVNSLQTGSPQPRTDAESHQDVLCRSNAPATSDDLGSSRSRTSDNTTALATKIEHVESSRKPDNLVKPRKVQFRARYPLPPHIPMPRLDEYIIKSHQAAAPKSYPGKTMIPNKDLKELLEAATGKNLRRRSNACGALKVLCVPKANQLTLVRTEGFLDAVVYAADADISPDDFDFAVNARTRAVQCILSSSEQPGNRHLVFSHPNLPQCLVKCIIEDKGEARAVACAALATLAKTPANREPMVKVDNLVDSLAMILMGSKVTEPQLIHKSHEMVDIVIATEDENTELSTDDESTDISSSSDEDNSVGDGTLDESTVLCSTGNIEADDSIVLRSFSFRSDQQSTIEQASTHSHSSDSTGSSCSSSSGSSSSSSSCSSSSGSCCSYGNLPTIISVDKTCKISSDTTTRARLSACAVIVQLSRQCAVAAFLCSKKFLMDTLVDVASRSEDYLHTRCLEVLCNLSRFPSNNGIMAKHPTLVNTFLVNGKSRDAKDRLWSLRTCQNLSSHVAGKTVLAVGPVLEFLSVSLLRKSQEEQFAAMAALYNLSTEPGAVVPMTSTQNVIAALVYVTHSPDSHSSVRKLSCEALANFGLWLQTLAGIATVPEGIKEETLPTFSTSGWQRWD